MAPTPRKLVLWSAAALAVTVVYAAWPSSSEGLEPGPGGEPPPGADPGAGPFSGFGSRRASAAEPHPERSTAPRTDLAGAAGGGGPWTVRGTVRDEATGAPIASAEVGARLVESRVLDFPDALGFLARTESDEEGRYRIDLGKLRSLTELELTRSWIELRAEAPAYARGSWEQVEPVDCRDGGALLDLELAPFHGLHGRVVDIAGQPVGHAGVACIDEAVGDWFVQDADPDGRFQIEVEAGRAYVLGASHPAIGYSAPMRVLHGPGATEVPDLVLDRQAESIAGTVRFAGGAPVDGAGIEAMPWAEETSEQTLPGYPDDVFAGSLWFPPSIETGEDGRFAFHMLSPGEYRLSYAELEGELAVLGDGVDPFPERIVRSGELDVPLVANCARLDYRVLAGGVVLHDARVNLRVWSAEHAPEARGAAGSGLPYPLALRKASLGGASAMLAGSVRRVWAPWDGFAVFEAFAPGYEPALVTTSVPPGAGRIAVDVPMRPRAAPGFVKLRLIGTDGAPMEEYRWRFLVGVLDPTGIPEQPGMSPSAWKQPPSDGRIGPLPTGRGVLEVRPGEGSGAHAPSPFLVVRQALVLAPGAETSLEVRARAAAHLLLEVWREGGPEWTQKMLGCSLDLHGPLESPGDFPTAPAWLATHGEGVPAPVLDLERGKRVELVWSAGLPPGTYELELTVEHYRPVSRRVTLRAGENRVPILLEPR